MSAITKRDVENVIRTIFRRCVQCPTGQTPACPVCPSGEMCIQVPPACDVCALTKCIKSSIDPTSSDNNKPSGPNVGAVAGGSVGGVAVMGILIFLLWRFYIKGRRRSVEEGHWQEVEVAPEKSDNDFASRRSARASTHTVASMASSVLTRASNIIQIAYIPGVTNRSGPGSPDLLVPPVPPIPIATTNSSPLTTPYSTSEQHFFLPDLRGSTYSGISDVRSSYARTSIAPSLARSSVATTIYRNNAIVSPLPAQTIVRGKAAVVSVKSSASGSPADSPSLFSPEAPPTPRIDPKHLNAKQKPVQVRMPGMGSSSLSPQSSIRSTATLGPVRALTITKKNKGGDSTPPKSSGSGSTDATLVPPVRPLTDGSLDSDFDFSHVRARKTGDVDSDSDSDIDDHSRAKRALLRAASTSTRASDVTDIQDTPGMIQSPFSDNSQYSDASPTLERPGLSRHFSTHSGLRTPLTPVMEESSKRASGVSKRTQSPFSDDNEVRD